MRKLKYYAVALMLAASLASCGDDYDDSELKKGLTDLTTRVEKLETWCNTANGQISALQGLVSALESKDYVTGVTPIMEGTKEVGYTITFAKSKPITLMNGKDGVDGNAPVIGVKQDTDGLYYWTVKTGEAEAAWMTDAEGNKIRTTGDKGTDGEDGTPGVGGTDGHSPVLSVAEEGGKLYWKVDGEWLLNNGGKVPATGDKGETGATGPQGPAGSSGSSGNCLFATNGIDYTSDPNNVTFTLKDGTTKITLPKTNAVTIGLNGYDVLYCTSSALDIPLIFPATLQSADYTSIIATITNETGTGMDIQSRAANSQEGIWKVVITKPTFSSDGKIVANSSKVTITPPVRVKLADMAVLRVTIVNKDGQEVSVSRPIKYSDNTAITTTAGNLSSVATDMNVTKLAVKGSINETDFTYIRSLTKLEVLDLSMTDLTSIPDRALRFDGGTPNTALKEVKLPATVKTIGYAAFANCRALTYIDTEKTEIIAEWAFEQCISLREVILHNGLKEIRRQAFNNCISLTSIDIPGSVTDLGKNTETSTAQYEGWVFNNCMNLSEITLHEGLTTLYNGTFSNCGIISIVIPSTVTSIPDWAFQECKYLENISLHNNITEIGSGAFLRCASLKNITIPTGVTVIKNNMFDECKSLRSVTFHNGITEIQERAFAYCASLQLENSYPNLPTGLTTLGEGAFSFCTGITSVRMKELTVTTLPSNVFSNCSNLNDVQLPSGLTTIGQEAFISCTSLPLIVFPSTLMSIGDIAFHNCPDMTKVYCLAQTAPSIANGTFGNDGFASKRTLYIQNGVDKSAYSSWSSYFNVVTNTNIPY